MPELSYVTRRHGPYLDIEFNRPISEKVRAALRSVGFIFHYGSHSWRGTRNHDLALYIADGAVKRAIKEPQAAGTLCDSCQNSGHGDTSPCCWERDFTPVPGWTAIPTTKKYTSDNHQYTMDSYAVRRCPNYKREPKRRRG